MYLRNIAYIEEQAAQPYFSAKMVFNERGAIFFPVAQQHQDMKGEGLSYQDNYKGNALAAMLAPGRIEIRFHQTYPDAHVTRIIKSLKQQPELAFMADWEVTYQGRNLSA